MPQSSILGPLFLIYIIYIFNTSTNLSSFCILFADDITASICSTTWHDSIIDGAIQILNFELVKVTAWFDSNKLTKKILNIKCEVVVRDEAILTY